MPTVDAQHIYSIPRMSQLLTTIAIQTLTPDSRRLPILAMDQVSLWINGQHVLLRTPASALPRERRVLVVMDGRVGGIGIDVGRVFEVALQLRARRPCLAWIGCWWLAQAATVQRR